MKTCLTCGSSVADDAGVCPDCGMEFESPTASAAGDRAADYNIDSGDENAGMAPLDLDNPTFEFSRSELQSGPEVALEKPISTAATPAATVPSELAMARLTLRRGGALTSEIFRFGSGAIVGRFDPDSGPVDIDLAPLPEASYVSRHHAEFRHDASGNRWFIKDMGSSNGTFWRARGAGAFVRASGEQPLSAGDEISLGNARFEFGTD